MLATESPLPLYHDEDGRPLDDGYLYFGQPNQNPETAPLTVYWDAAGTQPAPQPIRTLNGYSVRYGAPSLVYTNTDYSLTVKNRAGVVVTYHPNSRDFAALSALNELTSGFAAAGGAGKVGYSPTTTPVYPYGSVGAKLKRRVEVEDFKGDAGVSDLTAINLALDYLTANGGGELHFTAPEYTIIDSRLNLTGRSNITLCGNGARMKLNSGGTNTPFIMSDCDSVTVRDFQFDGQLTQVGQTTNFHFADQATHCRIINCEFRNYGGFAVIFNAGSDNHVISCRAYGDTTFGVFGTMSSGFNLVSETNSTIELCQADGFWPAVDATLCFPFELKNQCVNSHIIDCIASNCRRGFHLGVEDGTSVVGSGSKGCTVKGMAYKCAVGISVQYAIDCDFDVVVDQNNTDVPDGVIDPNAVAIAGFNGPNTFRVKLRNLGPNGNAVNCRSSDQTIFIDLYEPPSGTGKMLRFGGSVERNRAYVSGVQTVSSVTLNVLDLVQDDSTQTTNVVTDLRSLGVSALADTAPLYMPMAGVTSRISYALLFQKTGSSAFVRTADTTRLQITTQSTSPGQDNAYSSGSSVNRWTQLFAATATIGTSDEREKQQIGAFPDEWLDAWGDVQWKRFKFNDAVAEKGAAARWHAGSVAQHIRDVFVAHGLDATAIGLLCYDEWPAAEAIIDDAGLEIQPAREAGNRWGIRYEEALVLEAAYQRRKLAQLEARISALES